jgi:hypothetical protein
VRPKSSRGQGYVTRVVEKILTAQELRQKAEGRSLEKSDGTAIK